jgi:hypothetical protein
MAAAEEQVAAPTAEETKDAQKAEEAGFASGFGEVRGETGHEPAAPIKEPVKNEPVKDPPAAITPAAPDPWAGVPQIVKDRLTALDALPNQMRTLAGHLGGLKSQFQAAADAAKTAARAGTEAPSAQEIAAAGASGERWSKLKDEFPEWAAAMDERLAGMALGKAAPVDLDAIKKGVTDELNGSFAARLDQTRQQARDEARRLARVDAAHDGWDETINTPEFKGWAFTGGPNAEELSQQRTLEQSNGAEAEAHMHALLQKYPQWWADRGHLIYSDKAADAIKLLDAFKASAEKPARPAADPVKAKKRLEDALTPQGSSAPQRQIETEEDAFAAGFNGVRKKAA